MSNYETLAAINVNDKVEKKQKFSYLSWAWAVDKLMRADPTANWEYPPSATFPDGTMMVFCTVTAFGIPRTMQLPVINHSNKPISNPNAFDINTSMQRCLVKAIALHGLGLYLYGGEDLPPDTEEKPKGQSVTKDALESLPSDIQNRLADMAIPIKDALSTGNTDDAFDKYTEAKEQLADEIQGAAFWALFGSAERSAIKKVGQARAG